MLPRLLRTALLLAALTPTLRAEDVPRPLRVHIIAGGEYDPVPSMTQLKKHLEADYRIQCTTSFYPGTGSPTKLDNIDDLKTADVLVLFARRMGLREEQMKVIRSHWDQAKPIVGIRTACHAFQKADNEIIDRKLFGGEYAVGPTSNGSYTTAVARGRDDHPASHSRERRPAQGQHVRLRQRTARRERRRAARRGPHQGSRIPGDVGQHAQGGPVLLHRALGSPEDFQQEGMTRLIVNAVFWTTDREPEKLKK